MPVQPIFGDVGDLDPDQLRAALKTNGITRIDTAARYRNGQSEQIIGTSGLGKDFTIDTKVKVEMPSDGTLSAPAIEASLLNSLQVLRLPKIHVLYCHAPDWKTPIAEQAKAFNEHYRKGRFTYLGVSNFGARMLQEWLDIADAKGYVKPSVYQGQYNLLCRSSEEEIFPLLRKHEIHFAAYSPLAGGFLLGNFTADGVQGGNRFKDAKVFKDWYDHRSMHEAVMRLKSISEKTGLGMDELSLRWLKHHSILRDGDVMIMGASKVGQIGPSCAKANKGPLEEDVAKALSDLWEDVKVDAARITASNDQRPAAC